MAAKKIMSEKEYIDYFENHPKVMELKSLMTKEYSKGNFAKAGEYASKLNALRNRIAESLEKEKIRLSDLRQEMSEEDNNEMMFYVNKLVFLADMIDEAIFGIREIMRKYHSEFFAFDDFHQAAKLGKKHTNILMYDKNETVQDIFVEFTEELNEAVNKMIKGHIFKKDECDEPVEAK